MDELYKQEEHTNLGDDGMNNAAVRYNKLDLQALMGKKNKIVSSEEALMDVKPIEWDEEVLRGEKRIIVTKAKD